VIADFESFLKEKSIKGRYVDVKKSRGKSIA